ncbi:16682_t:CDS:2, partial [Acaulospora morrowiae]
NKTYHKNLHCGNVMKFFNCNIADLGLCGPSNSSEPRGVYGSLPFVAPEVLAGGPFSVKADIYSFAFIMWELSSGRPPFSDRPHDHSLALEICHGFRESICQLLGIDEGNRDNIDELDRTLASEVIDQDHKVPLDIHPFAFYTSKFLLFPNLPEPRNSAKVEPVTNTLYSNVGEILQAEDEITYEEYDTNCPPPPESDGEHIF